MGGGRISGPVPRGFQELEKAGGSDLPEGSCPRGVILFLGSLKSFHLLEIEQKARTAEATPQSSTLEAVTLRPTLGRGGG